MRSQFVVLLIVLATSAWFCPRPLHAQLPPLPDRIAASAAHSEPVPKDSGLAPTSSGQRPLALRELPRNLLHDQKFLWLRPFRLKRSDVPWAAALVGATAALIATDRPVGQELSDSPPGSGYAFSRRVSQFSGWATDLGVAGAFYLVGHWRSDARARETGLLAAQAVLDSIIIVEILKTVTQRPRPTRAAGRVRNHNADGQFFAGGRAFPSGHAAQAWALATVIAQQYRHQRWVAPIAYGLAGMVSVARVTQRKHFPADIFVGSVLGYLIGRYVYHTYAHDPPATPADFPVQSRRWLPQVDLPAPNLRGDTAATITLTWQF